MRPPQSSPRSAVQEPHDLVALTTLGLCCEQQKMGGSKGLLSGDGGPSCCFCCLPFQNLPNSWIGERKHQGPYKALRRPQRTSFRKPISKQANKKTNSAGNTQKGGKQKSNHLPQQDKQTNKQTNALFPMSLCSLLRQFDGPQLA